MRKSRNLKIILHLIIICEALHKYFLLKNYPIYCKNTLSTAWCKSYKNTLRFNFCLDPKSIIFVFSVLIFILLIPHHLTEVAFICNLEKIFWIFLLEWWFVASSTNRDMFSNAGYKNMSFINKMKNKGPRTEPWGKPDLFSKGSDKICIFV